MSKTNGLPKGWEIAPLSSALLPQITRNPKSEEGDYFEYVDIDALDNKKQVISTPKRIATKEAPSRARMGIHDGDVVFSLVRPYLKNIAVVPASLDGQVASTAYCVLRPAGGIEGRFLFYQVLQDSFIHSIPTYGNSPPSARDDEFLAMHIRVAPTNEQRRIVAKIEELFSDLDAGIVALERIKINLKRYRSAVLKAAVEGQLTEEWRAKHPKAKPASKLLERILAERRRKWEEDQLAKFAAADKAPPKGWREKYVEPAGPDTSGLPELPEGWCWATVEQTSDVQGGIQKQPKRTPRQHCFPFLRVANVYRNRLELDEVHQIELFGDELNRLRLQPDDLLVVEGNGSKTEIGRSAIWNGEIENCVHQNHIIRVRFLAGKSRYLNSYWNSPSGNGRVREQAASTSGLYTLSVTKVCALPVPLAPLVEQQEIIAEVETLLSVIAASEIDLGRERCSVRP